MEYFGDRYKPDARETHKSMKMTSAKTASNSEPSFFYYV